MKNYGKKKLNKERSDSHRMKIHFYMDGKSATFIVQKKRALNHLWGRIFQLQPMLSSI